MEEKIFWVHNRAFGQENFPVILSIQGGKSCLACSPGSPPELQLESINITDLCKDKEASTRFTFFVANKDGIWRFESAANPGWFLCTSRQDERVKGPTGGKYSKEEPQKKPLEGLGLWKPSQMPPQSFLTEDQLWSGEAESQGQEAPSVPLGLWGEGLVSPLEAPPRWACTRKGNAELSPKFRASSDRWGCPASQSRDLRARAPQGPPGAASGRGPFAAPGGAGGGEPALLGQPPAPAGIAGSPGVTGRRVGFPAGAPAREASRDPVGHGAEERGCGAAFLGEAGLVLGRRGGRKCCRLAGRGEAGPAVVSGHRGRPGGLSRGGAAPPPPLPPSGSGRRPLRREEPRLRRAGLVETASREPAEPAPPKGAEGRAGRHSLCAPIPTGQRFWALAGLRPRPWRLRAPRAVGRKGAHPRFLGGKVKDEAGRGS
ncbi:interleukin-1 receptor antagonist protein-like [Crotalus adamanteus]|uniref:Interleukin-1 n=1 Tax=Crotalus adamanteus TaxID=8729 RepID=A0AAW1AZA9_CROAD